MTPAFMQKAAHPSFARYLLVERPLTFLGPLVVILCTLLTGCTRAATRIYGLAPEYPGAGLSTWWTGRLTEAPQGPTELPQVDSTQPTLRWESFPAPRDQFGTQQHAQGHIYEVVYDLKIWRHNDDDSKTLAYSRTNLNVPYHKLESPLWPRSIYLWSVRARFLLNGQPRVTEWGKAITYPAWQDEWGAWSKELKSRKSIPASMPVPNALCYRFRTP
jgi:hypothetical protein